MKALLHALWDKEMGPLDERYRPWVSGFVVIFTIIFTLQFTLVWHNLVYLGPGLGDDSSLVAVRALVFDRLHGPEAWQAWAIAGFVLSVMVFRAGVMLWSYFGYPKVFGKKFPMHIVLMFIAINAVGALSIPLVLALLGLLLMAAGFDFSAGWLFMEQAVTATHQWIMAHVPTVVELPAVVAVLAVYLVAGFFHYWLHRLGHESRALWLLFHRHHHMSPNLSQYSTAAVFFAFPLFIVFVVPYVFLFGAISKLFYAEPLYVEIFLINCVFMIPEIFGHSDVFYERARKWKWASIPGFVFCNGVYHYLHHSAEPADAVVTKGLFKGRDRRCNMVNMGGGLFFLWDIVFGTFAPLRDKRPPVGLTGEPPLHTNPVRLALSGITQLAYELKMNTGWLTRFKILFGPSDYTPPVSRDYAVKKA